MCNYLSSKRIYPNSNKRNDMKTVILSSKHKIIVDILLIILLPLTWISGETEIIPDAYWRSFHCIIGSLWALLITLHIIQHLKFIKALPKKKVFVKNKTTVLTTIAFIIIIASILTLIFPADQSQLNHHHRIGKLFCIIVFIHTIQKWKRLTALFRNNKSG